MTRSAGWSGVMRFGSPPRLRMASRIAARSTTVGTPVKSCSSTRAGMKAISRSELSPGVHEASERMSSAVTDRPSSRRNRFSSRILSDHGMRSTLPAPARSSASKRWSWYDVSPTRNSARLPKLSRVVLMADSCLSARRSAARRERDLAYYYRSSNRWMEAARRGPGLSGEDRFQVLPWVASGL